ncbi:MAG: DNA translocase FtsK [Planctomycetaceae bacterium]|nr:DNA translocase FtsK [Planctomycetaceae bacterium]|tara:strand:+ start:2690 stop:5644 length:2955 start_codon:yes stop_codon:yes gene_type:complete
MLERDIKRDLLALTLCAGSVFLATALVTYHPNDPIGELIPPFNHLYQADLIEYPTSTYIQNACGKLGALAADILFSLLGFGAYYLLVSLVVADIVMLRRRSFDAPAIRLAGWMISLCGVCTCLALTIPAFTPGPVMGSGGMLGASFSTFLQGSFATTGGLIFALSLVFGGLMLATDYMVVSWVARSLRLVIKTLRGILLGTFRFLLARRAKRKAARVLDVMNVEDEQLQRLSAEKIEEQEYSEPEIRIGGRSVTSEYSDAMEDEEDEVVEQTALSIRKKRKRRKLPRPHFRVKKAEPPLVSSTPAKVPGKSATPLDTEKTEREQLMESLESAATTVEQFAGYEVPSNQLLERRAMIDFESQESEVRQNARILEKTFKEFGFNVRVVDIETGPVITQYEIELEAGLRLSKITSLSDDIAIALRVPSVRIVAPIPGKNSVGIEVPNGEQQLVRMREVIEDASSKTEKMAIPIYLGKDVSGNPIAVDLCKMPHLLIAGRTGSGKSVCLHTIVSSILMARRPDEVRLLMVDPKMVELSVYGKLPHLMHPVVTDMKKAEAILAWAVEKMEERYRLLAQTGVRHISSFNSLDEEQIRERLGTKIATMDEVPTHMPYIVIVADELADLMMTAGKDVEQHIIRLAQKSRAVGIHLVLATQKPTVDVITGLIKSNLPARLAFQVASRTDSRVVLDEMGAEKLLGNGDMLFLWPGTSTLVRGQGTFLSDEEIERVVEQCTVVEQKFEHELVNLKVEQEGEIDAEAIRKRDELYESAIEVVLREGRGSCSLLQRALGIGYGRAARMIDYMAEDGIVGQHNGSSAREILMNMEEWELIKHGAGSMTVDATAQTEYEKEELLPADESVEVDQLDDDSAEEEFQDEVADGDEEYEYEVAEEDDEEYEYEEDDDEGEVVIEYVYEDEDEQEDDQEYEYAEEDEEYEYVEEDEQEPKLSILKTRKKTAVAVTGSEDDEELWEECDEDDSWADEVDEEFDQ